MASKDPKEAVASYISDMLSLEHHIKQAVDGQISDLKDYPEVTRELERLNSTVEFHISALEGLATARGAKGMTDAVKKVGSKILGLGAAAVDLVRNEGLPKNLRDDYTAISLATISYAMLHTTALALNDQEAAALAIRHMSDYAKATMTIHELIPSAVLMFLRHEGLPADAGVLGQVTSGLENVWRDASTAAHTAGTSNLAQNR